MKAGCARPPPGFLAALRALADERGCLLIFDEVQAGMGRCGTLFAHEQHDATPDMMTLAKALGNGIPIGAMCARAEVAEALVPGTHASTFGGNPLACSAAAAVFDVLLEDGVLEHGRAMGEHLAARLEAMAKRLGPERVVETRGAGLLRAVELPGPVADAIAACRERGVLVIQAGANTLRLAPPLVIEPAQLDEGVDVLEAVLGGDG